MTAPPRFLEQLLASLGATPAFREPLLGDLAEEFALRAARDGTQAARGWYRREALRSAPHLLHDGVRHLRARDLVHLAGVVLSAWVLLATVVLLVALPLASAALRAMGVDVASLLTFAARSRTPGRRARAGRDVDDAGARRRHVRRRHPALVPRRGAHRVARRRDDGRSARRARAQRAWSRAISSGVRRRKRAALL